MLSNGNVVYIVIRADAHLGGERGRRSGWALRPRGLQQVPRMDVSRQALRPHVRRDLRQLRQRLQRLPMQTGHAEHQPPTLSARKSGRRRLTA